MLAHCVAHFGGIPSILVRTPLGSYLYKLLVGVLLKY